VLTSHSSYSDYSHRKLASPKNIDPIKPANAEMQCDNIKNKEDPQNVKKGIFSLVQSILHHNFFSNFFKNRFTPLSNFIALSSNFLGRCPGAFIAF
jgi:hypothetical protein